MGKQQVSTRGKKQKTTSKLEAIKLIREKGYPPIEDLKEGWLLSKYLGVKVTPMTDMEFWKPLKLMLMVKKIQEAIPKTTYRKIAEAMGAPHLKEHFFTQTVNNFAVVVDSSYVNKLLESDLWKLANTPGIKDADIFVASQRIWELEGQLAEKIENEEKLLRELKEYKFAVQNQKKRVQELEEMLELLKKENKSS